MPWPAPAGRGLGLAKLLLASGGPFPKPVFFLTPAPPRQFRCSTLEVDKTAAPAQHRRTLLVATTGQQHSRGSIAIIRRSALGSAARRCPRLGASSRQSDRSDGRG